MSATAPTLVEPTDPQVADEIAGTVREWARKSSRGLQLRWAAEHLAG